MQKPNLHPRTLLVLDSVITNPSHALILTGPSGVGKKHLAKYIADQLLNDETTQARQKFSQINITPDEKGTIGIDQIRELYQNTHSSHQSKQIITILNADSMGEPAQNAFLKLLEEPPANVHFVLTVDTVEDLLPTIVSRTQILPVLPLPTDMITKILSDAFPSQDSAAINQAILKSSGRVGHAFRLLNSAESDFIDLAKSLLTADRGERIIQAQTFSADRATVTGVLQAMLTISEVAMQANAAQAKSLPTTAWANRIALISTSLKRLKNHGNSKIQLLNVLYNL